MIGGRNEPLRVRLPPLHIKCGLPEEHSPGPPSSVCPRNPPTTAFRRHATAFVTMVEDMADPITQSTGVQKRPTFDVPGDGTPVRRATTNTNIARANSRTSQASKPSLFRALTMPSKPVGDAPPFLQGVKAIITMSCEWRFPDPLYAMFRVNNDLALSGLNVLLVCIPVSVCWFSVEYKMSFFSYFSQWALHFALSESDSHDTIIFVCELNSCTLSGRSQTSRIS